jgi:hypothetical protein
MLSMQQVISIFKNTNEYSGTIAIFLKAALDGLLSLYNQAIKVRKERAPTNNLSTKKDSPKVKNIHNKKQRCIRIFGKEFLSTTIEKQKTKIIHDEPRQIQYEDDKLLKKQEINETSQLIKQRQGNFRNAQNKKSASSKNKKRKTNVSRKRRRKTLREKR